MRQELRSSFDSWFWIGVFLDVAINMSDGLQLSEGLVGAEGAIPQWLTHVVLVIGRRPQFLPTWASPSTAEHPYNMVAGLPSVRIPRESKAEITVPFMT